MHQNTHFDNQNLNKKYF